MSARIERQQSLCGTFPLPSSSKHRSLFISPLPPCLDITRFGKPWETSYRHAEKMLVHEARLLGLTGKDPAPHQAHPHKNFPIKRVYAIGDNPSSDVEGESGDGKGGREGEMD